VTVTLAHSISPYPSRLPSNALGSLAARIALALIVALAYAHGAGAEETVFNRRATATAQILAGIVPARGAPAIDRLVEADVFAEHQKWMADQWNQVKERIGAMENWRKGEVKVLGRARKTMLYPFSGPDFLNAYTLFPGHYRYIFFSLERPGVLPDLESVAPVQFGKLLEDVRSAFRDIFQRNYFITDYMSKQLTTPWIRGTVPVIATMMALMDRRIVRIEPVDLFPELTRAYDIPNAKRPRRVMRAVRIEFRAANGGAPQWLYYISVDATDWQLEFYPGFLDWIKRHGSVSVLLKSASYLLHDHQFEKTRDMILSTADYVIQDDTGLPYRYLNHPPWHVKLYGRYTKPIKALRYGYQADLESAYESVRALPELPFPFGYHWRGKKSGILVGSR
jgi:hypothetical protein